MAFKSIIYYSNIEKLIREVFHNMLSIKIMVFINGVIQIKVYNTIPTELTNKKEFARSKLP